MTDAPIRCTDDLIEALRGMKAQLGLSNEFVDQVGGLTTGHCDKVLGPTRAKGLSGTVLDVFLELFAVELVMRPNPEALARMEERWERRNGDHVRLMLTKVSMRMLQRAKPFVLRDFSRECSLKARDGRLRKISPGKRRKIARNAARARWKRAKAMPRPPASDPAVPPGATASPPARV
jgi:hypothetical protein